MFDKLTLSVLEASPVTGDNFPLVGIIIIALVAAVIAAVTTIIARRNRK